MTGAGPGATWYETLREEYRPAHLRILLIGESPPDPGDGDRRFFYSPVLRADNLYRGVAQAVYGLEPDFDAHAKEANLERLRDDGVWLIDAVATPINQLSMSARQRAIAAGAPALAERCVELAPSVGVIVCHTPTFNIAGPALRDYRVRLLHDEPLPFPLGNWRAKFVAGVREAQSQSGPR